MGEITAPHYAYDLDAALHHAAAAFRAKLSAHPARAEGEILHRLSRLNHPTLSRPLRPWCLAIRANDTRITSSTAITHPPDALQPRLSPRAQRALRALRSPLPSPGTPGEGQGEGSEFQRSTSNVERSTFNLPTPTPLTKRDIHLPKQDHTLFLTTPLLKYLSRPIHIPFPGLPLDEAAALLGCSRNTLRYLIKRGHLDVRYHPRLGGRPGPPVPVVYADRYLDPCSLNGHRCADPIFATTLRFLSDHIPPDLNQPVQRIVYCPPSHFYPRYLFQCPACSRPTRSLFLPLPPLLQAPILLPDHLLPQIKNQNSKIQNPLPSSLTTDHHPLTTPAPPPTFACHLCHHLLYPSRIAFQTWNHFIARITSGLLFGHEVPRPPDWPQSIPDCESADPDRPSAHAKSITRHHRKKLLKNRMTPRRQAVLRLLLQNRTYAEITHALRPQYPSINLGVVASDIQLIRRLHNVTSTPALAQLLNVLLPPRLTPRQRELYALLLTRLSFKEIAQHLGRRTDALHAVAHRIYKQFGVAGRKARQKLKQLAGLATLRPISLCSAPDPGPMTPSRR